MKERLNSISVLKGFCCIMVFFAHFLGLTGTFGIDILDKLILGKGVLNVFICGNLAVDMFIVMMSYLAARKALKVENIKWSKEIIKRYIRLTVPCGITAIYSVACLKSGVFCHYSIGIERNNPWLYQNHWGTMVGWKETLKSIIWGILFKGDSKCYPAFWMMRYMFTGMVLAMLIATSLKELNRIGKMLIIIYLALIFTFFSDPYYLCVICGVILAMIEKTSEIDIAFRMASPALLLAGWCIGAYSFTITGATSKTIIRSFSAFLIVKGTMGIYEWIENYYVNWNKSIIHKVLVGMGNISFGVYCTHLIVMCTFASYWIQMFKGKSSLIQNGFNLALSFVITVVASIVFHKLVEGVIYNRIWGVVSKLFQSGI